jgi:drug/metabolite transporter (DMT)-like permease
VFDVHVSFWDLRRYQILKSLNVVPTALFSAAFLGRRYSRAEAGAIASLALGVVLLSNGDNNNTKGCVAQDLNLWQLVVTACGCWWLVTLACGL